MFVFFIFTICCSALRLHAQTRIVFSDFKAIDSVSIYACIRNFPLPLKAGQTDSITQQIRLICQDNGFFKAEVKYTKQVIGERRDTILEFHISENGPFRISQVSVVPSDTLCNFPHFSSVEELKGKIFSTAAVESAISDILKYLENKGYPFGVVKFDNMQLDSLNDEVNIRLRVDPNGIYHINRIAVAGKTETKAEVITRELRFSSGMLYNQDWIDKIPARLNRMKLFDAVGNPLFIVTSANEGVLQVPLQDKNNNTFDGVIGYIPGNTAGEKGYITGFLDIAFRNIFGTARAATFLWKRLDNYSSELDFTYLEPWIMNYPFNISFHLNQAKQDSTYVSWCFEPSLEYIAGDALTLAVDGGYARVVPSLRDSTVFTVFNSTKTYGGFSLKYDTRDDPFVPRGGILFQNSYSYTSKRINGPAQYVTPDIKTTNRQQKELFDFNFYTEPFRLNVLYIGFHGRLIDGDLIEIADLYKLGGANTLRGYKENQFLGQKIAWSNLEYRFILEKRTYAFVFFDAGFIDPGAALDSSHTSGAMTKNGYGFGLNFQTGLGMMNVSFAIPNGGSFSEGVIHFGLKNDF